MSRVRLGAAVLGCLLVLAACSGGDSGGGAGSAPSTAPPSTVGAAVDTEAPDSSLPPPASLPGDGSGGLNGVVLARALVQQPDLPGYEVRSALRPFDSAERAGLLVCGADLRAETGLTDGVQAVFTRDQIQVTVTVTAGQDDRAAATFVERFGATVEACDGPWAQDAARLGEEALDAEILGLANVGDPGVPAAAVRLRTTSDSGSSDVVVAVLAVGPVMTAVTVAGPIDADLSDVVDAVEAAARRANDLVRQLG